MGERARRGAGDTDFRDRQTDVEEDMLYVGVASKGEGRY